MDAHESSHLPCNVVADSAAGDRDPNTGMTDSGILADYEQSSDDETDSASSIVESGALCANISFTRIGDEKFVHDKEEMMKMVNILVDLMRSQQQTKSTSLTSKVFCKENFAMAIVGEAGCRLFFPDGSLTLVVPRGALAEEKVIYVWKPINTGQHESTGDTGKTIHYGPTLHCGTEGTTFLHKVKLSCKHYARQNGDSGAFKVQKCDNSSSPWNVLDDGDLTIHERTVDVLLSSFSIVRFIVDGQIETHVPMKAMACVFGVLQLPETGKVAHVHLVENDPGVIQANEFLLQNKGCKEEDVYTLPIKIDPRIDVTFTVITCNLGLDGHPERDIASIRPSSQLAHISLDLGSSAATTTAKCIKVSQGAMSLATYNIQNESLQPHTTLVTSPRQVDQDFNFEVPVLLSIEERPEETRKMCKEHSFEVYDGSSRMEVRNEESHGAVGGALGYSRLNETTRSTHQQTSRCRGTHEPACPSSGSPDPCLLQSRGSNSIVGNPEMQGAACPLLSPADLNCPIQRKGCGSMVGGLGNQEATSPTTSGPPGSCLLQRSGSDSSRPMGISLGVQKETSPSSSPLGPGQGQRGDAGNMVERLGFETIKEDEGPATKPSFPGQPKLDVLELPNNERIGKRTRRASIAVITPSMRSTCRPTFLGSVTLIERPADSGCRTSLPAELPTRNPLPPIATSEDDTHSNPLRSMEIDDGQTLPRSTHRRTRRASIDVVTPSIRNEMRGRIRLSPLH